MMLPSSQSRDVSLKPKTSVIEVAIWIPIRVSTIRRSGKEGLAFKIENLVVLLERLHRHRLQKNSKH